MATKKATTAKTAPKKTAAKKAPVKKTVAKPAANAAGAARAEGRKRNRELRDTLTALTPGQLKNFLKGMTPSAIARLKKALDKVEKDKVTDAIIAKEKTVATLQKEIAVLKKSQA